MKKSILAIALITMVSLVASATSIAWETTALSFDGKLLKNTSLNAYMIYLSDGALSSYAVDENFSAATIGTVAAEDERTLPKSGKFTGTFSFGYEGGANNDPPPYYYNDDAFALLVSYQAEDGKTYYNLSSVVNVISGLNNEKDSPQFNVFSMSNDTVDGNTLTAGGGWVAVPEPATGALALAGLALLFRRKRA